MRPLREPVKKPADVADDYFQMDRKFRPERTGPNILSCLRPAPDHSVAAGQPGRLCGFWRDGHGRLQSFADKLSYPPKSAIDGGANIGLFSLFANATFPGIHLTCYEPLDKDNLVQLERNLLEEQDFG